MKELSKNKKALAIAVKDGWREAQDGYINYWAKVGEQSLYESQLIEKYQTYDALMPIMERINNEGVHEFKIDNEYVWLRFYKDGNYHNRYYALKDWDTGEIVNSILDALLDAIYYILCEVKNVD